MPTSIRPVSYTHLDVYKRQMDGSRGFADYNGRGILLRNYDHDREVRLTWSAVDKRLDLSLIHI